MCNKEDNECLIMLKQLIGFPYSHVPSQYFTDTLIQLRVI